MADTNDSSESGSSYSSEDEGDDQAAPSVVGADSGHAGTSAPAEPAPAPAAAPPRFNHFNGRLECAACRDDVTSSDRLIFGGCGHCVCPECACVRVLCAELPLCPFARCSRVIGEYVYRNAATGRDKAAKVVRRSSVEAGASTAAVTEAESASLSGAAGARSDATGGSRSVWDDDDEQPLSDFKRSKRSREEERSSDIPSAASADYTFVHERDDRDGGVPKRRRRMMSPQQPIADEPSKAAECSADDEAVAGSVSAAPPGNDAQRPAANDLMAATEPSVDDDALPAAAPPAAPPSVAAAARPVAAPEHSIREQRWHGKCAELREWLDRNDGVLPGYFERQNPSDKCKSLKMSPSLHRWVGVQERYYSHFVEGLKCKETWEKVNRRTMTLERKAILDGLGFEEWWEYSKEEYSPLVAQQAQAIKDRTSKGSGDGQPEDIEEDDSAEARSDVDEDEEGKDVATERKKQMKPNAKAKTAVPAERHAVSKRDELWENQFLALQEHKARTGAPHVTLAQKKADASLKSLYHWCVCQRSHYSTLLRRANPDMAKRYESKSKSMPFTKARLDKLESIGFVFAMVEDHDVAWERRYLQLLQYKEEHGHCSVPYKYADIPGLGYWVDGVRKSYRGTKNPRSKSLTDERISRLEGIGFKWQTKFRSCFRKSDAR